jgi:hypothetical protein
MIQQFQMWLCVALLSIGPLSLLAAPPTAVELTAVELHDKAATQPVVERKLMTRLHLGASLHVARATTQTEPVRAGDQGSEMVKSLGNPRLPAVLLDDLNFIADGGDAAISDVTDADLVDTLPEADARMRRFLCGSPAVNQSILSN